jgi:mono/diheme cytochrome c family protein
VTGTRTPKAEMDFRELSGDPAKLFGLSYVYFLGVLALIGLLYIANLNTAGKNSVAPPPLSADSAATDIPLASPRAVPPLDVMKAASASGERVARGAELFKANCAACHGDEGRGDGASAALLNPHPRNFHSPDGWKNGPKVSAIYKTLQEGIPSSGMSSFSYLVPEDRFALAHYVRTFHPAPPADAPGDLAALDAA